MTKNDADFSTSRRTAGKWHIINELDLVRLVADHSQIEQMCHALLGSTRNTPQLPIRIRDLLDTVIIPHARNEEMWLEDRLVGAAAPPTALTLLETIRIGHCALIHGSRRLAAALEASPEMPWEQIHGFVNTCHQAIMLETLAISYLAGPRLTPEARQLLEGSMISLRAGRIDA